MTGSNLWRDASHFASQGFPPQFAFTFRPGRVPVSVVQRVRDGVMTERSFPVDRFLAELAHAVLLAPVPTPSGHAIGRPPGHLR